MAKRKSRKNLRRTPTSVIKNALHHLWMRSREPRFAVNANDKRCKSCGRRHSTAKGKECQVQAHHIRGINWDRIIEVVRVELLQISEDYMPLCKECHAGLHDCIKAGKLPDDANEVIRYCFSEYLKAQSEGEV